jgi:hypothetical protein
MATDIGSLAPGHGLGLGIGRKGLRKNEEILAHYTSSVIPWQALPLGQVDYP